MACITCLLLYQQSFCVSPVIFQSYHTNADPSPNISMVKPGTPHFKNYFIYLSLFFGHTCGMWKFPGYGSNLSCSYNLHHSWDHARSLTHYTMWELLGVHIFNKMQAILMIMDVSRTSLYTLSRPTITTVG